MQTKGLQQPAVTFLAPTMVGPDAPPEEVQQPASTGDVAPLAPQLARFVAPRTDARQSPAQAVLGTGQTAPPAEKPTHPRAPTLKPPAVIGSTSESVQISGPLSKTLTFPPNASIQLWALPGSTIRVYNTAVLEKGKPKLLKEVTAPLEAKETGPYCVSGAYPTEAEFEKAAAPFRAAKGPGMLLAAVRLGPEDDHSAYDTFLVTQQSGARPESEAVPVKLFTYSAPRRPHQGTFEPQVARMHLEGSKLSASEDWALRPGTDVTVYVDGNIAYRGGHVDDSGRFSVDLAGLGDRAKIVVAADGKPLALGKLGLAEKLPDARGRIASWDAQLLKAFLCPGEDGRVQATLHGLPEGLALTLTNPSSGSKTFTVSNGQLCIDLDDTWAGDTIVAKMSTAKVAGNTTKSWHDAPDTWTLYGQGKMTNEHSPRSYSLMMDGSFTIPKPEQAARMSEIIDAMSGYGRSEIQSALELFGPHAGAIKGGEKLDQRTLRELYEGARLGSSIPSPWAAKVAQHLAAHGVSSDIREGFKLGQAYLAKHSVSLPVGLSDPIDLRQVKAAEQHIVATGGYSPISGSHGPLIPEVVSGSSTWELRWGDLPPLTLMTAPGKPQGWVNPAAYVMAFGLDHGVKSVDYLYTPSSS